MPKIQSFNFCKNLFFLGDEERENLRLLELASKSSKGDLPTTTKNATSNVSKTATSHASKTRKLSTEKCKIFMLKFFFVFLLKSVLNSVKELLQWGLNTKHVSISNGLLQ